MKVGDKVVKGQLIARIPDNSLGAALHASISGTVTGVDDQTITLTGE